MKTAKNFLMIVKSAPKYFTARGGLAVFLLLALFLSPAGCELMEEPGPEVGRVDLHEILTATKVGQEHQERLDERGQELEEQYRSVRTENPLETSQQEDIYQRYLAEKEELEEDFSELLYEVLEELAGEKDLHTVLTSEAAPAGALDITEEVKEKLEELAEEEGD